MKKGLALLSVLGIVAQEGWTKVSVVGAGGVAVGAFVANKKQRECKNSEGKIVERQKMVREERKEESINKN